MNVFRQIGLVQRRTPGNIFDLFVVRGVGVYHYWTGVKEFPASITYFWPPRGGSDIAARTTVYSGVVKRRDSTPETVLHNAIEIGY